MPAVPILLGERELSHVLGLQHPSGMKGDQNVDNMALVKAFRRSSVVARAAATVLGHDNCPSAELGSDLAPPIT